LSKIKSIISGLKSIRARFLRIVIPTLLIMAMVMGAAGMLVVNKLATDNSEKIMNRICKEQTYRLDGKLNVVKHSTNLIYEYMKQVSTGNLTLDYLILRQYEDLVEELALSVANQTDGAMAVYFRYAPEVAGDGTSGFFWTRDAKNGKFTPEETTDILKYDEDDVEHVGWYYIPKKNGEPMWMTPYYNKNLDVFMISYVIPIYTANSEFIGVIGMDIDFNSIMDAADDEDFYKDGIIALVDLEDRIMYFDSEDGAVQQKEVSEDLILMMESMDEHSNPAKYEDNDGHTSMICVSELSNGMLLYVGVPNREIYRGRNSLLIFYVSVSVLIFVLAIILISKSAKAIISPIKKLSQVTSRYAEGDWSEKYVSHSSTEIEQLSEDISVMAENTQKYINRINTIARRDVLTELGNKTAYVEMVEDIKRNRQDKYSNYEIVVMDLNLLKKANDNYGHEAGDALLKEAGRYMSIIFSHSALFRIGGDEFVAILTNEDYANRAALIRNFETGQGYIVQGEYPLKLYISFGGAEYGVDGTDFDDLFKIADDRMYAKKKEMKMGRTD